MAWVVKKKEMKPDAKPLSMRSMSSPKRPSNSAPVHAGKEIKSAQPRHRPSPTLDFSTPRHTRSRSVAEKRMDQVKDMGAKDVMLEAQIFEIEDLDGEVACALDSQTVTVAMTPPPKMIEGTSHSAATPKWLTTSVNKKRSSLPMTIPIQDMVAKYSEKNPKLKRFKTTMHLNNDEETSKWMAEIASYKSKDENKEASSNDFEITKVELGKMSRDTDNHFFQVSAKKMLTRSEKDGQEKRELKRHISVLAQFIDSIGCLGEMPISHAIENFDPTSPENKKLMNQVQRAKSIVEAVEKWIEQVIKDGEKYIIDSWKLCDEVQGLISKIQNQLVPWEKEEHKWQNVLPLFTKIKEYRTTRFLTEHSIKLVSDECQLFVLKKTIMWWVLTFQSVITDAKTSIYELQDL